MPNVVISLLQLMRNKPCIAELQRLRQQVVADIRNNRQLEDDLALMDIKIGLLVKNRITLQVSLNLVWSLY